MELDIASKVTAMLGGQALEIARLQALVDKLQERIDELEEHAQEPRIAGSTEHMVHPARTVLRPVPVSEVVEVSAQTLYDQDAPEHQ